MIVIDLTVLSIIARMTLADILCKRIASLSGQHSTLSIVVAGVWLTGTLLCHVAVCAGESIITDAEGLLTRTHDAGSSIMTDVSFTGLTLGPQYQADSEESGEKCGPRHVSGCGPQDLRRRVLAVPGSPHTRHRLQFTGT